MIFVAIVDGKTPILLPFVDENGRNFTVNGTCYLYLLNEVVWPTFRSSATQKGYLLGVARQRPAHCRTEAKGVTLPLSKSSGAEWPISKGQPTGPISTRWISIFWYWPRGESTQQCHLLLLTKSVLKLLRLKAAKMCWRMRP